MISGHNLTLYEENPKDSTEKLLEVINKFSKAVVAQFHEKSTYKIQSFLYNNNEQPKEEIKKIIPYTIASK